MPLIFICVAPETVGLSEDFPTELTCFKKNPKNPQAPLLLTGS